MNIFKRDLIHRIRSSVLYLLLFIFHFLPYVTCQLKLESTDHNGKPKFSEETIIAIIVLGTFILLSMVACCLHKTFYSAELEAAIHEALRGRAKNGLEKEFIDSFPSFLYSEVKELKIGKGGVECAICLSEFEDQETLRYMPPCSHIFHASCIDVWLSSCSTCPVCRTNLSKKPDERFPYPSLDLEMSNAQRGVLQEPLNGTSLICNNANHRAPRSRFTTRLLSRWRMGEIFFSRSHSTRQSLLQLGENQDRFTLQVPEEVYRQLVMNQMRISHSALPRAMSTRQGYRNGCIRSGFYQG